MITLSISHHISLTLTPSIPTSLIGPTLPVMIDEVIPGELTTQLTDGSGETPKPAAMKRNLSYPKLNLDDLHNDN